MNAAIIRALLMLPALVVFTVRASAGQGSLDQRVGELSQQIAREMSENQKKTIAVVEFVDLKGNTTDFGRFLAEELITRLYQVKKFKVIERQLLNKVIAEQKLSLTGIVDPDSARQLGRILNVDAIAAGTITDLAQSLRVNARLISTETGEIFAVASTEVFKDDSVIKLTGQQGTPSPSSTSAPNSGASQSIYLKPVHLSGFTFELKACKLLGTRMSCEILITSNEIDRNLTIKWCYGGGCDARIIDDQGNEFNSTEYKLGQESFGPVIGGRLTSGVPTKAVLIFDRVVTDSNMIKVLELPLFSESAFGVRWRDVPIKR